MAQLAPFLVAQLTPFWVAQLAPFYPAIITGVATCSAPMIRDWWNKKDKLFHVIVLSTSLDSEAIREARRFENLGYSASVYSSSNGKFAVSLGEYAEPKANALRKEVVLRKYARDDSFLADPIGLVRKIYPLVENIEKLCFIIVYSNTSLREVNKYAKHLQKVKCDPNPSIRRTSNGLYAVVLGEHKCETASKILDRLIKDKVVYRDSYVADDGIEDEIKIE